MTLLVIFAGIGGFIIIIEELVKIVKWIKLGIENIQCAIELDKRHKRYDEWLRSQKKEA